MQLTFSCTPSALKNIEGTISPARLGRYAGSAGVDKQKALQLYVWNARLCEAFYLPIQLCEVAIRNAIHGALENLAIASADDVQRVEDILKVNLLMKARPPMDLLMEDFG